MSAVAADERLINEARAVLATLVRRQYGPGETADILIIAVLALYEGAFMPDAYDVARWQSHLRESVGNLLGALQEGGAVQ